MIATRWSISRAQAGRDTKAVKAGQLKHHQTEKHRHHKENRSGNHTIPGGEVEVEFVRPRLGMVAFSQAIGLAHASVGGQR